MHDSITLFITLRRNCLPSLSLSLTLQLQHGFNFLFPSRCHGIQSELHGFSVLLHYSALTCNGCSIGAPGFCFLLPYSAITCNGCLDQRESRRTFASASLSSPKTQKAGPLMPCGPSMRMTTTSSYSRLTGISPLQYKRRRKQ
ncbi:hypothetical protein VIGAN_04098400 [Vigna angularis var. angularis]|uniref:Uncharacterized protein n=1 Tax=Vigna angularis var. angularis TaxID=157739 RepID=A0A0S3RT51_PHAAN|nr:hypothetical protein VIGAN_04098400 [Vigna angularis var. angularis]